MCETVQPPAWVCVTCGLSLKLKGRLPPEQPIVPVEGLETNAPDSGGETFVERLGDLEPTGQAPTPDVRPAGIDGFEATAQLEILDPFGDDGSDRVPDLERTCEPFERTAGLTGEASPNCPWCGYVQATGRVCDHCGRSRTRILAPLPAPVARARRPGDDDRVRCPACGAKVLPARLCSDCGTPLAPDDA